MTNHPRQKLLLTDNEVAVLQKLVSLGYAEMDGWDETDRETYGVTPSVQKLIGKVAEKVRKLK